MRRNFGPRLAFEPPSDYVPAGQTSGAKKIWMVLGGGCLLVLIAIGIAFAAGAFQVVSCCNQAKDIGVRTMEAQNRGAEFAMNLSSGDYEGAYAMTTEEFKGLKSKDDFVSEVKEYEKVLQSSPPQLMGINARQGSGEGLDVKRWRTNYQFAAPADTEMVVLSFDIVMTGEPPTFGVTGVDFDRRTRNLAAEAPATEVMEFHRELQRGNYEMAFGRLGEGFKTETDMAAFKAFLQDQGDIMTDSELEIKEVGYPNAGRATVIATATTDSGQKAVVQFELATPAPNLPMWQIMAISPMIESIPDDSDMGSTEVEPADAGTSD